MEGRECCDYSRSSIIHNSYFILRVLIGLVRTGGFIQMKGPKHLLDDETGVGGVNNAIGADAALVVLGLAASIVA